MELTRTALASMIDHTMLKPEATAERIDALLEQAVDNRFRSVCLNPFWVPRAAQRLKDTDVLVGTVVGFPLGADGTGLKGLEARGARDMGAQELDMVMNVGAFLSGDYAAVEEDIAGVVEASGDAVVKVILETGFLDDEQVVRACGLAVDAGADFVKTSTGFGPPCTVDQVRLMSKTVGDRAGVKASGGIRTFWDALAMIRAGADRLGTSSGVAIVEGWEPVEI